MLRKVIRLKGDVQGKKQKQKLYNRNLVPVHCNVIVKVCGFFGGRNKAEMLDLRFSQQWL
jgi:hypothetical protein